MDENMAKSFACLIPFLVEVTEVELVNNQITDSVAGAIIMACFANPNIKRIKMAYNFLRNCCAKTLHSLIKLKPEKV